MNGMLELINELRLETDFALRKTLKWSRKGYSEAGNTLGETLINPEEAALTIHYPSMNTLKSYASDARYRENLNLLSLLQQLKTESPTSFNVNAAKPLRCLEIGVKNWATLPATLAFTEHLTNSPVHLTGIEVDLWRVYEDRYSRHDALEYHLTQANELKKETTRIQIIEGLAQDHMGEYDLILCFLPFLFDEQVHAWGLPSRISKPKPLLRHIKSKLMSEGSVLVTSHQGLLEATIYNHLANRENLTTQLCKAVRQDFLSWEYPRHAGLYKKTAP